MRYKVPKVETTEVTRRDEVEIIDARFALDVLTDAFLNRLRLSNRAIVALSVPMHYDPARKAFAVTERAQPVQAFAYGRYYGATLPVETVPGDYQLAVDERHRLLVADNRLAVDDAGRLAVQNPPNLDVALSTIKAQTDKLTCIHSPADAETFTTTPLGANATYYGPSRDFLESRLAAMAVMGYADQPSAANGVYIQLSLDGTNWDYHGATATLSAAGAVALAQVVACRYARAVWTNGSTAQTAFRFGGRYMFAGSELPTVSPAPQPQPEPICSQCGIDMTDTSDFFVENGKAYCPKCYANKRWKELKEKEKLAWEMTLRAWLKHATVNEKARARMHAPDEVVER